MEIARDADLSERASVRIGQHARVRGEGKASATHKVRWGVLASHDGGARVETNGLMEDTPVPGF